MLLEMLLLFVVLGMLSNAILHFAVKKGNFIILLLIGATVGWFAGMLWMVFSPLSLTVIDVLATVILSIIPSLILIYHLPIPLTKSWNMPTAIATLLLVVALALSAVISLPQSYPSVANMQPISTQSMNVVRTLDLNSGNINNFLSTQPSNSIGIDFVKANIQSFSTNATENQYLSFKITFSINKADWAEPFITFGIFKDNGDGKVSVGDELWQATNYKVVTQSQYWRANLYYKNGQPQYEIFGTSNGLLPIFHASQITQWKDDSQYTFSNTPETYKPPVDMLSWDGGTLKERVASYASIPAGSSSSIEGKIYCPPNSHDNYYILIRAYDARFTNPYNPTQPLAEKLIPFTISQIPKPEVSINALMVISLALPGAMALAVVRRWL